VRLRQSAQEERQRLMEENRRLQEELKDRFRPSNIIGNSKPMQAVYDLIAQVSKSDATVLIRGESGVGKELVAAAIHYNSRRAERAFIKVNLAALPETVIESELFGHEKGAFTGALAQRKGRFELAHGGTIFLDEIGETEPSSQVKLLRVLQDRTYEALGSSAPRTVDVRVVSATNRELGALVAAGQFREDLLYRLNLITVHLPALRERPGDVPRLAASFARQFAQAYGREVDLSASALRWLAAQPWPGNVRQLRQWIERAVLVGRAATIEPADLEATGAMESRAAPRDALPPVGSMTLEQIERAMIAKSLKHHGGNLTRVAESLGMSRPALYRRLEKYGLQA
jgi:Nif-specific regulatory protein